MSCPNCPCAECVQSRAVLGQAFPTTADGQDDCMFVRIARDYAARNEPMPTSWLLWCPCKRCNPTC